MLCAPEAVAKIRRSWGYNASRYGTQVVERLARKVLNLPGNDLSTYLDGLKARAGQAHARLKSIGVLVP
jgi:hypothetical protein